MIPEDFQEKKTKLQPFCKVCSHFVEYCLPFLAILQPLSFTLINNGLFSHHFSDEQPLKCSIMVVHTVNYRQEGHLPEYYPEAIKPLNFTEEYSLGLLNVLKTISSFQGRKES